MAETIPTYELIGNIIAVVISTIAVIFWIRLYKKLYRNDPKEARGWSWLFVGVLAVLLFNIASIYLIFTTTPLFEFMKVLGRTIIAISLTIGAYLLYSPMKKGFTYRFVPVEPVKENHFKKEGGIKTNPKHFLQKGHSYLVNEERPLKATEIFVDLVDNGAHGLYITRRSPDDVRKESGLKKTPIIWLTREKSSKDNIDPRNLVELSHTIREFTKRTNNGIIILDGLEYLIIQNNYNEILKFVQGLNDAIALSNSSLIVPIDPSTINQQELHLLRREMSIIRTDI